MAIVTQELLQEYRNWWDGKNTDALMCVRYPKPETGKSAEDLGLVKPWMEGHTEWILARAVSRAYETKDMSPVADALELLALELDKESKFPRDAFFITMNASNREEAQRWADLGKGE